MGWRKLAAALVATTALLLALPATPAGAHAYSGSYTTRLYHCGLAGKHACQAHYLLAVDSPLYGPLWEIKHSHGCTSQDGMFDKWQYLDFRIKDHGGTTVWRPGTHIGHDHTSQWCGWSVGTHEFYPNTFVPRGDNVFHLWTSSYWNDSGQWYSYSSFYSNA